MIYTHVLNRGAGAWSEPGGRVMNAYEPRAKLGRTKRYAYLGRRAVSEGPNLVLRRRRCVA